MNSRRSPAMSNSVPLSPPAAGSVRSASEERGGRIRKALPHGVDTLMGREFGGVKLSGGQAQRVGIARALYKSLRVLVLDEPTSAIDAVSEQTIFDRIMGHDADDRVTICISHRFTTLTRADRILVFESGRIVESGAPSQLKTAGGPTRPCWRRRRGSCCRPAPASQSAASIPSRSGSAAMKFLRRSVRTGRVFATLDDARRAPPKVGGHGRRKRRPSDASLLDMRDRRARPAAARKTSAVRARATRSVARTGRRGR